MEKLVYYTFLAGWCADAAGARLEFRQTRFTKKQAIDAMHFVGEKTNGIPEGQFTDDSEMELCLLQALVNSKKEIDNSGNETDFPIEKIAEEYIKWFKSKPFDIGNATTCALHDAQNADDMANNAFKYNKDSESNGSLMRCLPIAVFCINKPDNIIMDVASIDASLTHYSDIVQNVTGIYCCIISKILTHRLKNPTEPIDINALIQTMYSIDLSNTFVNMWIYEALELNNLKNYNCIKNEGHIKHAFILFTFFLKNINAFTYENAIIEVFKCGGDTDTNGKIVGNLFGAYYGNCVPEYMSEPVLNFDCTTAPNYYRRPENYGIKHGIELVQQIPVQSLI